MADDLSRPVSDGPDSDSWLVCDRPDLGPLRAAADRAELADAKALPGRLARLPLRADDPLAPLARELARELTLAGFTLHHCVRTDPLYRLGGVCLLPVCSGVAVSWTTHTLLSLDWDRWSEYHGAHAAMNRALGEVLSALGFRAVRSRSVRAALRW